MEDKGRTFVIGDIHGGLKALEQVLTRAGVTEKDTLIFLGDYVDGWSESAQVINRVIQLAQQQHCYFIKGNHDVWCENWLRKGELNAIWQMHGGKATIASYNNLSDKDKALQLDFLEQMPYYHIDAENRLFIHAGFTSMHGPEKEFHSSNFNWDRTLWEMAIVMDERITLNSALFPKRLLLFKEIFIGHTPTTNYGFSTPMRGCNVWNVDTGAAFKGPVTIMDIDTKAYWQSDPVWQLYPHEKGRNLV